MKLDNKNIIITGGAGGIGSSTVRTLLNSGANVGVFDRDKKGLDLLKKSLTDSHKKKNLFL